MAKTRYQPTPPKDDSRFYKPNNPSLQYSSVQPGKHTPLKEGATKPDYAYPKELKTEMRTDPFVHIRVVDPFTRIRKSHFNIALPMPASMRIAYNAEWVDISFDQVTNYMLSQIAPNSIIDGNVGQLGAMTGIAGTNAAWAALQQAGKVAGDLTMANANAPFEFGAGKAVNPHAALLFQNMSFREFQLRFVLMAKDQQDDEQIKEIIFQLKYAMHPGFGGAGSAALGHGYYDMPENFILNFYAPNLHSLIKTHPCALVGLDVEYNGSGVPSYFATTHRPVCYILNLHFKELVVVTKENIQEGW